MSRVRGRLAVVLAMVAGAFILACGERPATTLPTFEATERRPNVLVVLVDVLRRDHLGAYGYPRPTSPNIDTFAEHAQRFDRAFSHSNWTKPSVATLFTSVYPDQHGIGRVGFESDSGFHTDVLPLELSTMAESFKAAGYVTASFGGNVHIQRKTGFAQGFDKFFMQRTITAFTLNRRFQDWYESEAPATAPFFAYVHYMDVHWPYERRLPEMTDEFGSRDYPRKPPPKTWSAVPAWADEYLDDAALAVMKARYDNEIAFVDEAFGRLMAWLESAGLADDTIVLFVADHGEGFNEHGELQHTFPPYTEVTSIPMLLRLPPSYRLPPAVHEPVVGLVDVMPTLLDLVGLEAPREAQGRSLAPVLLGERLGERPLYLIGEGVRGMRTSTRTWMTATDESHECYDLAADPTEQAPLADAGPCDRLALTLDAFLEALPPLVGAAGNTTVELDAEDLEALEALGYLN